MARRLAVLTSLFLLCTALPVGAAGVTFTPGANGVGDRYFPRDGNGGYDVDHYLLQVRYRPATDVLRGVATIDADATQDLSRFNLDFVGLTVHAIRVNGTPATWTRTAHELRITPATGIPDGSHFQVVVEYSGVPEPLPDFGLSGFIHTDDGAAVVGEPHVAATWFPVNDHPTDKASYTFAITVPSGREAIANGHLISQQTTNGWTTWTWDAQEPMASYLATMMIGQFEIDAYSARGIKYWDAIDEELFESEVPPDLPTIIPTDGAQMLFSQVGEPAYKRLTRVVDVPAGGTTLSFDTFHDTEPGFDFLFVERRSAGGDNWTTLRETTGKNSQDPGACPFTLDVHPFLSHYLTPATNEGDPCLPTGTSGVWWAAYGEAVDWETWTFNLGNAAATPIRVEVSITYASDFSVQLRGVTLDNVVVGSGAGTTSFEDDGDPLDGWVATEAPEGSAPNPNTWAIATSLEPPPPPPPLSDLVHASFARQPEITQFLSGVFGRYPFSASGGIVDNVPVIFALENQTRPTYSPFFFAVGAGDVVVVHELAHQWIGDSLAVERWQDIWLNEGFATYAEWLWSAHEGFGSEQEIFDFLYNEISADDPFWELVIGDPGPEHLFDQAVYVRGAMTLHQLRVTVGDSVFFRILQQWVRTHAGGNVTTDEFIALAENVSGMQLDELFDAWLFTPAKPTVVDGLSPQAVSGEANHRRPPHVAGAMLKIFAERDRQITSTR